jgi:hypothetical protein
LINFCTRSLPKTESAGTSRRTTNPLRGIRYLSVNEAGSTLHLKRSV